MSSVEETAFMLIPLDEDTLVSKQLHAFCELESLGITSGKTQNPEEEGALHKFAKTTTLKRWTIPRGIAM